MYGRQQYRFGPGGVIPPGIKNLLYANGAVFLLMMLNQNLGNVIFYYFAFTPALVLQKLYIWQFFTYMFLHGGFMHIAFNMFALWMFGAELEREWGTKEFLKFYFIAGLGGAIFYLIFSSNPMIPMVGASGGVLGVLLAFAMKYPDRELVIFPIMIPIKAKYVAIFYGVISFLGSMGTTGDGIAHAAHLGGMVFGWIYLKYWYQYYKVKNYFADAFKKKSSGNMKYTRGGDDKTAYYRQAIDELLDKINRVGYLNLTEKEKKLLEEGSKYLRENDPENYH